jgi:hypothetical protein
VSQSKTLVELLQAPYDSGHLALRMGAGPSALAAAGAADRLRAAGHDVREQVVTPTSGGHGVRSSRRRSSFTAKSQLRQAWPTALVVCDRFLR